MGLLDGLLGGLAGQAEGGGSSSDLVGALLGGATGGQGGGNLTGVLENEIYAGDSVTRTIRLANGAAAQVTEAAFGRRGVSGTVTLSIPPAACLVFPR